MTDAEQLYEAARQYQNEKRLAVLSAAQYLHKLSVDINFYAIQQIEGTPKEKNKALDRLPIDVFKNLPRAVLQLQDALNR